jgi:D-aminoacyl-tRNA deacylase
VKVIIQRADKASVQVEGEVTGKIDKGLVLLVCFEQGDTRDILPRVVEKITKLRCFNDEQGKMNLNISQIHGAILSISQFTLSWDGSGGHRPSFEKSQHPGEARMLWAEFNRLLKAHDIDVQEGRFGCEMKVEIINDGPVTFIMNF